MAQNCDIGIIGEAGKARSNPDFINKIKICESEASETQYWLDLITETKFLPVEDVKTVHREGSELLVIFCTIGKGFQL
jgi:four helix bundle protein